VTGEEVSDCQMDDTTRGDGPPSSALRPRLCFGNIQDLVLIGLPPGPSVELLQGPPFYRTVRLET